MKPFAGIFLLIGSLYSQSHSKQLFLSFDLGGESSIDELGIDMSGAIHLGLDGLYRLSNHALVGFGVDANTWSWTNPFPGGDPIHQSSGKLGFFPEIRLENRFENEIRLFGKFGAGPVRDNVWYDGSYPYSDVEWRGGAALQAGVGFEWAQFAVAYDKLIFGDNPKSWFTFSFGVYKEFF